MDLSGQQERVLSLVAKGITNKEIAVELGLSDKTVRNYLTTIFQKLHVIHRTEAAVYFTQKFPLDPGR
ncbi:MAG: helix-turn-helix transcriptional regulator [Candidatus Binatia bacterium]